MEWIEQHKESSAKIFEMKVESSLQECVDKAVTTTRKLHSDHTWTAYHSLRTSDVYVCDWECILLKAEVSEPSAISYQYIGDYILKTMFKTTYPARKWHMHHQQLNYHMYEEINLHKRISFDKLTDMTLELRKELKECDSVQFIWYL